MSILTSAVHEIHPFAAVSLPRSLRRALLALLIGACLAASVASRATALHTSAVSSAGIHTSAMRPDVPCSGGLVTPC